MKPKKKQFAREYIKTEVATEAVRRVYPQHKDPNYIRVKAHRLKHDSEIQQFIREVSTEQDCPTERVFYELNKIIMDSSISKPDKLKAITIRLRAEGSEAPRKQETKTQSTTIKLDGNNSQIQEFIRHTIEGRRK